MNPRVLILVFDLVAALLHAERHGLLLLAFLATTRAPARRRQRITDAADIGREIARVAVAGIEVLMDLLVGQQENWARQPQDGLTARPE
jgi:hypothetical protein